MKKDKIKFSSRTISFLVLLILAILLVNAAYNSLVLPKKTFYHKEMLYQNYISNLTNKKIDYVFFGDSHTFHDVNPEFIKNSYNYGTGAENYIKTFYKLRKMIYLDKVKVNTVIFEVDLHTFSTRLTDKTHLFNELELYSKFVSIEEIKKVRKDSVLKLWIESNIPFISNGKEFGILFYQPEISEVSKMGWLKNTNNFSLTNKTEVALKNYKDSFEGHDRFSNVSMEYFEKTLKLAEDSGSNIVIIMYPYAREYEDVLKNNGAISREEYYRVIFEKINNTISNYSVLDYSDIFLDEDYLFGDPAHLNYIGAERFSKIVDKDLEELNLSARNYAINNYGFKGINNNNILVYFGLFLIFIEIGLIIFMLKEN